MISTTLDARANHDMPSREEAWGIAFNWVCHRRRHAPSSADIWHLRYHWDKLDSFLFHKALTGAYRLSPMRIHRQSGRTWVQWTAADAMVLKWVALQVSPLLPVHKKCSHLKGHGGGKESLSIVWSQLTSGEYQYVCRTDIRGYYQHIQKNQVLSIVKQWVKDHVLVELIRQYLYYTVEDGGEFYTPENGICRGCALSPLIAGSLLYHVDKYFASVNGLYYTRYMDDFLILTGKRWPLRRAIKHLYGFFDEGGFERHPDKTRIGKIDRGFDWLGVWFTPSGTSIAPRALNNHTDRCQHIYERAKLAGLSHEAALLRVSQYREKWARWATSIMPSGKSTSKPD